jgi:hypothetical protein
MRIATNLALYPATSRRRSAWLLALSVLFCVALTAAHFVWAFADTTPASRIRGDAELLSREASVLRARLNDLHDKLDPVVVRELSDRVDLANEFIVRGAIDPVAFLELIESTASPSLVVERLSLVSSADGVGAELALRADSQSQALALVDELRRHESIRDITPVSEQFAASGDQIVLSLRYQPQRFGLR